MIIKDGGTQATFLGVLIMSILLVGVGGLYWAAFRTSVQPTRQVEDVIGRGPFAEGAGVTSRSDLDALSIEIAPEHVAVIEAAQAAATKSGTIVTRAGDLVPARVTYGGKTLAAHVRLKGDWLDHVDTDKWSFRIELDDGEAQNGMNSYSIQHPKTRGFVFEWMIMKVGRRDGLMGPRTNYVSVTINGRPSGIYYLEEQFSKQMVEACGRRDGPIVKFNEDLSWNTWRQYQSDGQPLNEALQPAQQWYLAEVDAFDKRRLGRTDALNRRLQRSMDRLRQMQRVAVSETALNRLGSLRALEELHGKTLDGLFVADKLGRMMALFTLFRATHSVFGALNMRFYHDPVIDRLEPVLWDTGANPASGETSRMLLPILVGPTLTDAAYEAGYLALADMSRPEYLEGVFADLGEDLRRYGEAMVAEGIIPDIALLNMVPKLLVDNASTIRSMIRPLDCANFMSRLVSVKMEDGRMRDEIEVDAWATTNVPVEISGFTFSNGRSVAAASAIGERDAAQRRSGGRVMLPRENRHLVFRFPVDARLAELQNVAAIKRAIRAQVDKDKNVKLAVDVRFAPITSSKVVVERLGIQRLGTQQPDVGRPEAPSLLAVLDAHPFLSYDLDASLLRVRPGDWVVSGDLVLPSHVSLAVGPATSLRFSPGAVLLTNASVDFVGTAEAPVKVGPLDNAGGWGGLVVIGSRRRSRLQHVVIRGAQGIDRGGWQSPGGVTFYRSSVVIADTQFHGGSSEDVLNIVGARMDLTRVMFTGGASDLFDGDFVNGTVKACEFSNSGEDAIDVSGSRIEVSGCQFREVGDKALSIGEGSHVSVRDCRVESASIALAAKDKSQVNVSGLTVRHAEQFGVAVYIKKSEFGASSVVADRLSIESAGREPYLVQTGCSLVVDKVKVKTKDLDVADLYARKILGK